ncbi:hypothetical protein TorRG33x02_325410 [Trema orientale]|uniref:Uncharacterized protein n=1 Tax=Trema orientale TaxID=63057 RepID=A0A2P5BCZ4_TREOI|nr:hypothetical protein TorRG33x02_325410 [Trema orientale]
MENSSAEMCGKKEKQGESGNEENHSGAWRAYTSGATIVTLAWKSEQKEDTKPVVVNIQVNNEIAMAKIVFFLFALGVDEIVE